MLVGRFVEEETGNRGCGEKAEELLSKTSHLIRARSVAYAAGHCVFLARIGETMGIRGFTHSILPGKGQLTHMILALSFPRLLDYYAEGHDVGEDLARAYAEDALDTLLAEGVVREDTLEGSTVEESIGLAGELTLGGIQLVGEAFSRLGFEPRKAVGESKVLVEHSMMSYSLHTWGVADAIVEHPEGYAVVIEWKTYYSQRGRAPQPTRWEEYQVLLYAMLEAERLGLARGRLEEYEEAVIGRGPRGEGARVIPGIVRPSPTGRASRYVVSHPLLCTRQSTSKCSPDTIARMIKQLVLAAEHLTLLLADIRLLSDHSVVESLCKSRDGRRIAFRKIPSLRLGGEELRLPRGNPLREPGAPWVCRVCPDAAKRVCRDYLMRGQNPLEELRREAWRARFSIYKERENALRPYRELAELASRYGHDMGWIRGKVATRILSDGSRIDMFDTVRVEGDEVVLSRPPMKWEEENGHLVTLREGKPAALFLDEPMVEYPLHRVGMSGTVSRVEFEDRMINVYIAPASKPSRIYPLILARLLERWPEMSRNAVALEVNVDLTQIDLLGVAGYELGAMESEEELALLFAGVSPRVEGEE